MLVGLVGFINSGKGTVGELLASHGFRKDSFAAPLKDAASAIFGWDRDLVEGATVESRAWREQPDPFWSEHFGYEFTPRKALQWLGTEAMREVFHKDIWAISLMNRYKGDNTVVTDVRFKNEINHIHQAGGVIIRVVRGPEPEWYTIALKANSGDHEAYHTMVNNYATIHVSEWDWIGGHIDYTIYNNADLFHLEEEVNKFLFQTEQQEKIDNRAV